MPEKLQVLDLPSDFSHHVQAADLLPVQDLHRHLVLGQLMLAHCGRKQHKSQAKNVKRENLIKPPESSKVFRYQVDEKHVSRAQLVYIYSAFTTQLCPNLFVAFRLMDLSNFSTLVPA